MMVRQIIVQHSARIGQKDSRIKVVHKRMLDLGMQEIRALKMQRENISVFDSDDYIALMLSKKHIV